MQEFDHFQDIDCLSDTSNESDVLQMTIYRSDSSRNSSPLSNEDVSNTPTTYLKSGDIMIVSHFLYVDKKKSLKILN